MRCAGIDIGSRTIELVVLERHKIILKRQVDSGHNPLARAKSLLEGVEPDLLMATGYGRHLLREALGARTVTEIKAYALGARHLFPETRGILDIGGQDSKAISLDGRGRVIRFLMNDRCAAGTGKFLEIMAATLGYTLEEFGTRALEAERDIRINSTCAVFAESEVTSLVARGENRRDIALALHRAATTQAVSLLRRVSVAEPLLFAGGVARNTCMKDLLCKALGMDLLVPEDPQGVGALGAALLGAKEEA
ncbi:MAG: 3-hydroxyacyl-ACP dehydratase [Deltaproteobacteria bacterium]|nr:3-hydroxyacyl-ACP dehydratase [Deltaproteobacteria bacterium]MBW2015254.1 3-hydroxyacyl-ACP dehydratase [Deltaproteobacteria bacterium]MBW2129957.1 3-hydroxyacyl-ACP dehydratase [Deltaproteobacteria bacterium]